MLKRFVVSVFLALFLGGCAAVNIADYAKETPKLDLRTYFNGALDAHGVFLDRSGKAVKRFSVKMICTWVGDTGTLDESFLYSDGTTQKRIWTVKKSGDQYIGTASDVVGEAIGKAAGNALRWRYTMALPVDDKTYHVQFDDWMYLDSKIKCNTVSENLVCR